MRSKYVVGVALAVLAVLAYVVVRPPSHEPPPPESGAPVFTGVIADRDGRGVAGARVDATWIGADDAPRGIGSAVADPRGRYVLAVSPPPADQGVLVLRASAGGYGTQGRRVALAASRQNFRLLRGTAQVVVRVVSEDGAALSRAEVVVSIEPAAGDPDALVVHHGWTGGDGSWTIADISASAADVHWIASVPGRGRAFGTAAKPGGDATLEIVARLEAGSDLLGNVVDRTGRPVASVTIVARETDGPWRETTTSGGDGTFRIAGAPRGTDLPIELAGDWILAGESEQIVVRLAPGERTRTLRLVAEPAGAIQGRVVSASGGPIANAKVSATPSDHVLTRSKAVATADDGTFELRGLRGQTTWDLEVRHPRFAPGFADKIATTTRGLSIELRTGGTLVGGVDDDHHRPQAGIEVYAHRIDRRAGDNVVGLREYATVKTRGDGSFRIDRLNAGTYRVEYRSTARMAWSPTASELAEASVNDGQDTALPRVTIARGVILRVAVFTSDHAPARHQRLKVSILPGDRGGAPQRADVRTGADGSFVLDNLLAGTYQIAIQSDDHGFVHERDVKLEPAVTSGLEIEFPEASTLTGTIVDADGRPVAGALVDAYAAGAGEQAGYPLPGRAPDNFSGNFTRSDSAGHFRIAGLARGAYRLRISGGDAVPSIMDVEAPRDALAVRLARPAAISVRVAGRQPPGGSTVLIESHDGAGFSASKATDATGLASFAALPAGEYTVRAAREQIEEQHIVLRAGETKAVQFGG